jgi:hypothetical protein
MKRLLPLILALVFGPAGFAQTHATHDETAARVPALENLHVPIAQLWHTAWPAKDIDMMVTLLPELNKAATQLAEAPLPGILRDKQTKWNAGVERLLETLKAYATAAEKKDTAGLLSAGEELHARYESLVRLIRPAVKELGQFHEVLYLLYHHYMPDARMDSVASAAVELKKRMIILNGAQLPERLKGKTEQFVASRTALSASVDAFATVTTGKDKMAITRALEKMHTDYQVLEKVFD